MYIVNFDESQYQSLSIIQSVGLDNLGTNKLQESANDKKTWKQKSNEVFRGRRALVSVFPYNYHHQYFRRSTTKECIKCQHINFRFSF